MILDLLYRILRRLDKVRARRRWSLLRSMGMHIGERVELPGSTWIDTPHCYLITIGDDCTFGEECFLLSHDAQMDEFLDVARLGRITIHEGSHLGHRTIVLPGVEIGPRTVVLPNSVVMKNLPPETVCGGNPARVLGSLEDYAGKLRRGQAAKIPA